MCVYFARLGGSITVSPVLKHHRSRELESKWKNNCSIFKFYTISHSIYTLYIRLKRVMLHSSGGHKRAGVVNTSRASFGGSHNQPNICPFVLVYCLLWSNITYASLHYLENVWLTRAIFAFFHFCNPKLRTSFDVKNTKRRYFLVSIKSTWHFYGFALRRKIGNFSLIRG